MTTDLQKDLAELVLIDRDKRVMYAEGEMRTSDVLRRKFQVESAHFIRTHHATIQQNAEEVKILRIKAAGTLANNLCSDHRDKQVGKSCLACEIERLEKAALRLCALEQAMGEEVMRISTVEYNAYEACKYFIANVKKRADIIMREWKEDAK